MMRHTTLLLSIFSLLVICSCSKDNQDIAEVTQLALSTNTVQLGMGDTLTLKMTYTPDNLPEPAYRWANSNPAVATLDSHGKLTAIGRGETIISITATNNASLTAQCKVTVTYKGDGSVNNPYCIFSVEDLKNFRDSINKNNAVYGNKAYRLMADLDFSRETPDWISIGNAPEVAFKGTFDGNNKSIKNIAIGILNADGSGFLKTRMYAGLFGCIEGATISNLRVDWTTIWVCSQTNFYVGGIAGYGQGTISNCQVNGILSGDVNDLKKMDSYIGGIIGYGKMTTNLLNCQFESGSIQNNTFDSTPYAGGIAGYIMGTISNCHSLVPGMLAYQYGGGITGYSIGTIVNCYTTGFLRSKRVNGISAIGTGGISGKHIGTIINCYSTGNVYGRQSAGGIAGDGGFIINCYASGNIIGTEDYAGGIAGMASNISYCCALNSSIEAYTSPARICAFPFGSSGFTNNYANPSMSVKNSNTGALTTDFSNSLLHGQNLSARPVDLLNAYVAANPTYNGIPLLKWKVVTSVNNGNPVFE